MADKPDPSLAQLGDKILAKPIKHDSLMYCPSMDLFALVTVEEDVEIYRLNGQKVLDIPPKRSCQTTRICWKPNGSMLAIAYSDNSIALVASQGGKLVHQVQCPVLQDASISFLYWGINFTDPGGMQTRLKSLQNQATIDDIIHRGFKGELSKPQLDLPGDLAALDVEGILPKLSTLPLAGSAGDIFTSRPSLDSLFHSKDAKADSSDALLVGFTDGSTYLSVYDFFEIGRFAPKSLSRQSRGYRVVKSSSHPLISTLTLVLEDTHDADRSLAFATLDLRLASDAGRQFSQLATRATQVQNVLRYLKECQSQICSEFGTSQTLPHRFIANIEEDLVKDENCTFTTAAYHLVATGNCSAVMKEWLVDQLAERGQKRWEKASTSGYENIRRLIHENFLPALDRLMVLASKFRGLACFQETASSFGLEKVEIDHILDSVRCLQLLGHSALKVSDAELRQSVAFCSWLRSEIDIQATETVNPDEPEKEPVYDYTELLAYIEGPLQNSVLYELLDVSRAGDDRERLPLPSSNYELYDAYKSALKQVRGGVRASSRLPGMEVLLERLQDQCTTVFASISGTQQRKVRFGDLELLDESNSSTLDMRLVFSDRRNKYDQYVALASSDGSLLKVIRKEIVIEKGVSAVERTRKGTVRAGLDAKIKDVKFIDDKTLLVLAQREDSHYLVQIDYADVPSTGAPDLFEDDRDDVLIRHKFDITLPTFIPIKLEVNGRKGRRAVCVTAQDMKQYRVFDIDASEGDETEKTHQEQEVHTDWRDTFMSSQ